MIYILYRKKKGFILNVLFLIFLFNNLNGQTLQDSTKLSPHGTLWGYAFGDYAYKVHADSVGGGRGGSNQYSRIPKDRTMFQFRRIYLGYNYDISPKFSAELLLAAEDDFTSGDLLINNKFSPYIKLANVRWKNIWKGTDVIFGQVSTPSFPLLTEKIWAYRSVERTVSDIRRTPSFDLGIALQGHFIPANDNFGYNIMMGNGQGARPEIDPYKWFYAEVYTKLFNKNFIIDLYTDYNRINWSSSWHHSRSMIKGFVAYTTPNITIGAEAFTNSLKRDNIATKINGQSDTLTTKAKAISLFVRGKIYKDKLGFFARYDAYDPSGNINKNLYVLYNPMTTQYDPDTKENFITAGLDYTPDKNVHIMPNVWYNNYKNTGPKNFGNATKDHDLVYRLTCHWIFNPGK